MGGSRGALGARPARADEAPSLQVRCALQPMGGGRRIWLTVSGPQAVTVNTQMLHCSQEALGAEGKCLSAEELKNHSVHRRAGPREKRSVKGLVVPFCGENERHSLRAGDQQLARTLKACTQQHEARGF